MSRVYSKRADGSSKLEDITLLSEDEVELVCLHGMAKVFKGENPHGRKKRQVVGGTSAP